MSRRANHDKPPSDVREALAQGEAKRSNSQALFRLANKEVRVSGAKPVNVYVALTEGVEILFLRKNGAIFLFLRFLLSDEGVCMYRKVFSMKRTR